MKLRFTIPLLAILCLALASTALAQQILFDDGPTNGTIEGLTIDGPNPGGPAQQQISDGFAATGSGMANYFMAGIWVPTGETPTTLTWWLGTSAFAGDLSTGTEALNGSNSTFLFNNGFGYDIYEVTVTGLTGMITAGDTYYLTLGNGDTNFGDHLVYWDYNGVGTASCSFAQGGVDDGDCGLPLPEGEAFTLYGTPTGTVPEPGSLLLLGSGVLALAGLIRRRIGL